MKTTRRLLILDPDFTPASPSMKAVLKSFPELREAGFEIEGIEDDDAGDEGLEPVAVDEPGKSAVAVDSWRLVRDPTRLAHHLLLVARGTRRFSPCSVERSLPR